MQPSPKITYASPDDPLIKSVLIQGIEHLTGRRKIEKLYRNVLQTQQEQTNTFWEAALAQLQLTLDYNETQLARIPKYGPVLFIANHPYGVLDGLVVCYLAAKTRQSFKILINSALCKEKQIDPYLLPIDFNGTKKALQTNINTKKEALQLLRKNGTIVVFPAGGISTSTGPFGQATDLEWKLFTARLVQMSQATVVPIYFHGQNSRIFQMASQVSLTLRLSLIIHEVNNKIGKTIRFTIGKPIAYPEIANIKGRKALTNHLRQVTYGLAAQRPN